MSTNENMSGQISDGENSAEQPVKDLEVLSDSDLDNVSGGDIIPKCTCHCQGCVKTTCGSCGGLGGTSHEANFKIKPGDVDFSPTTKDKL
ncbi:hypothetical protein U5801_18310 [Lamprobacter modestohalophilus]|uniref:hypothetical protein n=1 Tax=Lamprobacter modestohalophilus TaxID=1064514 RepID=UPI002ADEEFF3|nr:hypothetical protein [Lamprobacter modestohalophilus]MEA1051741.1 hypothetical protein [Lamprobacter modestohalophilus]